MRERARNSAFSRDWPIEAWTRKSGALGECEAEVAFQNGKKLLRRAQRAGLDPVTPAEGELPVENRLATSVRDRARDHEPALEMRLRVRARKPVAELAIETRTSLVDFARKQLPRNKAERRQCMFQRQR